MNIIARVVRRYVARVDSDKLDQWKRDLRVMTKIYRDIPLDSFSGSGSDSEIYERVEEARKLFQVYREGFVDWVYKEVLKPKEGEALRKSAWNFRYTLDSSFLFPTMHGLHGYIPDLLRMRADREKGIKRYQVAATKAFKDLENYITGEVRRPSVEELEVGGIRVQLENYGREDYHEGDLGAALRSLRDWVDRVRSVGFREAVEGLTLVINFEGREALTTGKYEATRDKLTLYPLGLAGGGQGTFTHEVGHRYYFRVLPSQARAHWQEVMGSRGIPITREAVLRFVDAVGDRAREDLGSVLSEEDRYRIGLGVARTEGDKLIFKELSRTLAVEWDAKEYDRESYEKLLLGSVGETVLVEEISDYGRTSPVEAFAEVFRIYILQGPRALGPWTVEFFRTICSASGVKLGKEDTRLASHSSSSSSSSGSSS